MVSGESSSSAVSVVPASLPESRNESLSRV